ncbi:MAG: hypothetical protein NVS2B14_10740 [Chamaesiphon sp.]
MAITVKLRDRTFIGEPTDIEAFAIADFLLPGKTVEERYGAAAGGKLNLDLETPEGLQKATATLLSRLINPVEKARLAHTLVSVFPDIPEDWVRYQLIELADGRSHEDFKFKLQSSEVGAVIVEVLRSMKPVELPSAVKPALKKRSK